MCVALDTAADAGQADYEVIPHVTQMAWTETANVARIVTSSTGGNETSVCGPVNVSGTLNIACHSGDAPSPFRVNGKYNVVWGLSCDRVEDWIAGELVGPAIAGIYAAKIRIISVPNDLNPAAGGAVLTPYTWELVEWINFPATQVEKED
jgi:hypothetical protein